MSIQDLRQDALPPAADPGAPKMRVMEGSGVAPGIAIGPVYRFRRQTFEVEAQHLEEQEVDEEVARFERAVQRAERDLLKIKSITQEKVGEDSAGIFEAQRLMLHDSSLYDAVIERIRRKHYTAEYAVQQVLSKHRQRLEASDNERFRERANDLLDVQERLIRHLRRGQFFSSIDPNAIVIAESLTAADIILFSRRGILGCAMDYGGPTSHVSIMARALEVPAVVGLHGLTSEIETGSTMILDGIRGRVIVDPTPEVLVRYQTRQERYRRLVQEDRQLVPLPAETIDGHAIVLRANVEFEEEISQAQALGAEGIGLFRTEMHFLMQGHLQISEDEQYAIYRRMAASVMPHPLTIRILDIGGDKMLPLAHRERNPFLGWRGIRVLLDKPDLLIPQLRAALRASAHGQVRLLIPMVTNMREVDAFKRILAETKASLKADGLPFDPQVPLGVMVEVPAVALMADLYAAELDFFSIGTNDLTQYVLAVDRGNDLVAHTYEELHPAVLHLIQETIRAGHAHGLSVSLCGELATDPHAIPLLVGMGIDELSASPVYLPSIKRIIRAMTKEEGKALAKEALEARDTGAIRALLDQWLNEHGCGLMYLDNDALSATS